MSRRTGVYDFAVTGHDGRLIALARSHAHRRDSSVIVLEGSD